MSRLCLCLTSATVEGALNQFYRYKDHIDLVELRVDLLNPSERDAAGKVAEIAETAGIPGILTLRLPQDGGKWGTKGESEKAREELFMSLLRNHHWSWVDLEHNYPLEEVASEAGRQGTAVIRSLHDFNGRSADSSVSELAGRIRNLAAGGAIPKLAVSCEGSRQLLSLARLAIATEDIREKVILGMGEYGAPTRILAQRMGSAWTYTSSIGGADDPPVAAPGQLDPLTLQKLYRFRSIGPDTPLFAVIGNPIAHSRSPEIHNHWIQKSGMEGCYLPIRSDDAAALLETCDIWGIRGLSVTVPHKETVLSLCDYSGVLARSIGAANTLLRAGDGWRARNTDAGGFMAPLPLALGLQSPEELKGMKALLIGAGGAARAAFFALLDAGVEVTVLNRSPERAEALVRDTGARWGSLDEESAGLLETGMDFVVQTSAAGMHPHEEVDPIPWWNFNGCQLAYDMVYEPEETKFLERARKSGIRTMNGSGMLVNQAKLQFEMFTGHPAPED